MTVVLSPSATTNTCLLAFDNLLEQGTVTASSENEDHPIENAYDWYTTDFFKPLGLGTINIDVELDEPAQGDYLAFFAHDLHTTGCSIKLQYWNGSSYVDVTDTISPSDSAPRVVQFTSKTSNKWRVVISAPTDIPSIGVLAFGKSLQTERGVYLGYTEPVFARAPELINSESEGGVFLGRSVIHQGFETNLILQYASDAWARLYWRWFVEHAEQKPFFYLWNTDEYPNEAAFCWTKGAINPPTHTHYGFMGTSIPIRGVIE